MTPHGLKDCQGKPSFLVDALRLEQLLEPVDNKTYTSLEIKKYYNVYTWDGLQKAIGDFQFRRPKSRYLQSGQESRILQRIGVNEDEQ